jgi:hypothetical protein
MQDDAFTFRVTDGWLRDLASEPTPRDPWPSIRWDGKLLADQLRFLDVEAEMGVDINVVWGLFIDRAWPVPLTNVIDAERARRLRAFIDAAHQRGVKVLSGTGIYSWGFDEVISKVPAVSAGDARCMCGASAEAWDWQRRVLDFLMDPRWGLDGISMQSADQGRCPCPKCNRLSPAEYHANLLVRSAEYVRAQRPGWVIGQASWGLALDKPEEFEHVRRVSQAVDYLVEVWEGSAAVGRRRQIVAGLSCAFGSVGGVFVEPPQHWERLRWFLPGGLGSAGALRRLWDDGGRACEYFYRPFANPAEEVSWRVGARVLSAPTTAPEAALRQAVSSVYGPEGKTLDRLTDWFIRGERAYFSRSSFQVGQGSLSLEPLIWKENPAAAGPPVYLRDRMSPEVRADYARELGRLKAELVSLREDIPNRDAVSRTLRCIDGTLADIASLT